MHGMFLEHLLQKKKNVQIGYAQLVKRIFMSLSQFNVTLVWIGITWNVFVWKQLLNKDGGIAHDAMRYVGVNVLFIYNLYIWYYFIDSNVLFIYKLYTFGQYCLHIHISAFF